MTTRKEEVMYHTHTSLVCHSFLHSVLNFFFDRVACYVQLLCVLHRSVAPLKEGANQTEGRHGGVALTNLLGMQQ